MGIFTWSSRLRNLLCRLSIYNPSSAPSVGLTLLIDLQVLKTPIAINSVLPGSCSGCGGGVKLQMASSDKSKFVIKQRVDGVTVTARSYDIERDQRELD